jgi:hypothetical protein
VPLIDILFMIDNTAGMQQRVRAQKTIVDLRRLDNRLANPFLRLNGGRQRCWKLGPPTPGTGRSSQLLFEIEGSGITPWLDSGIESPMQNLPF